MSYHITQTRGGTLNYFYELRVLKENSFQYFFLMALALRKILMTKNISNQRIRINRFSVCLRPLFHHIMAFWRLSIRFLVLYCEHKWLECNFEAADCIFYLEVNVRETLFSDVLVSLLHSCSPSAELKSKDTAGLQSIFVEKFSLYLSAMKFVIF